MKIKAQIDRMIGENNRIKAYASVILGGEYVVRDIAVMDSKNGLLAASIALGFVCYLLFGSDYVGVLYGTVPEDICDNITSFTSGLTAAGLVLYFLHLLGAFDKVGQWKKKCRENKR